jgi:hypothetical protein
MNLLGFPSFTCLKALGGDRFIGLLDTINRGFRGSSLITLFIQMSNFCIFRIHLLVDIWCFILRGFRACC